MNKAIIIGATSGIGEKLAELFIANNYIVGITGRRIELLNKFKNQFQDNVYVKQMDISNISEAMKELNELIDEMGEVDIIVISAGIGFINKELVWEKEEQTIDTNVKGVTGLINFSLKYFNQIKKGQLVVITSLASLRGSSACPAYNASKAFLSNYLEGISAKLKKDKSNIIVTEIMPGLVNTEMAKGDDLFWVMPVKIVANQILKSIIKRKRKVIVTKRWKLIAFLMKFLPEKTL